ncbi:hypothetical protein BBP40_012234 [Aspergillus hancockii]|nr:hypothetical protein BBP40_012234 [Aspergillus hancockii]
MPRTLPWLTNTGTTSKSSRGSTPKRAVRVKTNRSNDSDATPRAKAIESTPKKRDFFRSSPTPPSSPIHRCPSEEFLVEGLSNDDIYIMVEDEFYTVAQSFTQHLHYAEYAKRRKEVKLQNTTAIQNLARPTDGVTPVSEESKRRDAADALSARQKAALEQMGSRRPQVDSEDEDEENEDETWAGTPLHGFMMSPRKVRSLVGMQGIKSSTKAAAGFSQSSGTGRNRGNIDSSPPKGYETVKDIDVDETALEDDDLDIHETPSTKPARKARLVSLDSMSSNHWSSPATPTKDRREKLLSRSARYKTPTATQSKRRLLFDDDFHELPELHNSDVQVQGREPSPSISKARHATPPRGKNPQSKKSRLNEVPTFLL